MTRVNYLTLENLSESTKEKVREFVDKLTTEIEIEETPKSLKYISLFFGSLEEREIKILNQLEKREGVLKIKKKGKLIIVKIDRSKFDALCEKLGKRKKTSKTLSLINFDEKRCVLNYKDKFFKLHKEKHRCLIFKELWKNREVNDPGGRIKIKGKVMSINDLSIAGKFKTAFGEINKKMEQQVRDAIQDFRDKIKKIGAPIKITAVGGYLLIIKE